MKKTKMTKLLAVLLVVCMMSTSVVGGTLAAYTSEVTGTGTVTVAAWGIGFKNGGNTTSEDFTISVATTKDSNSLVESTVIAPGDTGSFSLAITDSLAKAEVAYTYSIKIENANNLPIKFYTDSDCTTAWSDITGVVEAGEQISNSTTVANATIYWQWETYSDTSDTAWGVEAAKESGTTDYTFEVTMSATQLVSDYNYLTTAADVADLTADSNAVYYVADIDVVDAIEISNSAYTGKVIFGKIETDSTLSIYMPNATVEVGDLSALSSSVIDITTGPDTFVLTGTSANAINVKGGNVEIQPTATVSELAIASENTTANSVSVAGNVTTLTVDGGTSAVVTTSSTTAPTITNNVEGTIIVVTEESAPTIVATLTETYIQNTSTEETTVFATTGDKVTTNTAAVVSTSDNGATVTKTEIDATKTSYEVDDMFTNGATSFIVPYGATLTIDKEYTLASENTITNYGTIDVASTAKLITEGAITNYGSIAIDGEIIDITLDELLSAIAKAQFLADLEKAESGETVTLTGDVTIDGNLYIFGKAISIDLNQHNLTVNGVFVLDYSEVAEDSFTNSEGIYATSVGNGVVSSLSVIQGSFPFTASETNGKFTTNGLFICGDGSVILKTAYGNYGYVTYTGDASLFGISYQASNNVNTYAEMQASNWTSNTSVRSTLESYRADSTITIGTAPAVCE